MFYYVFQYQCHHPAAQGASFFGIKQTGQIDWGEPGTFLGITFPSTQKCRDVVDRCGMKTWRLRIHNTTADKEMAARMLKGIMDQVKTNPLCLNANPDDPTQIAKARAAVDPVVQAKAASEANAGVPKPAEQKKKIAASVIKTIAKKKAEAEAAVPPPGNRARWIHNPLTKEQIQLDADEDALTGFIEGPIPTE